MPSKSKLACFLPWENLLVRADGRVRLCCFQTDDLGNLNYQTFPAIWNGPKIRKIRRLLLKGKVPLECRLCPLINCYSAVTANNSENKSEEIINE